MKLCDVLYRGIVMTYIINNSYTICFPALITIYAILIYN